MGKVKDFAKWYFNVDLRDWTNYIALVIAALLLWWGLKSMLSAFSMTP